MRLLETTADPKRASDLTLLLEAAGVETFQEATDDGTAYRVYYLNELQKDLAREVFTAFQSDPRAPEIRAAIREQRRRTRGKRGADEGSGDPPVDAQKRKRRPSVRPLAPESAPLRMPGSLRPAPTSEPPPPDRSGLDLSNPDLPSKPSRRAPPAPRRGVPRIVMIRLGPLTIALIALCMAVGFWTSFGSELGSVAPLLLSVPTAEGGSFTSLGEVLKSGEVWRLLTPILVHFGILHLLLNMLWLKDLGSLVESVRGPVTLAVLVVLTGVISNVVQFVTSGSANFGGMSGVIYALLGFAWISGRIHPKGGLFVPKFIMIFMMIWFVVCFTGLVGNVANAAHAAGLLSGLAFGAVNALRLRLS